MENSEEILHCLEEFSKVRPKDIPRELEDYLKFVAKTGDSVYQWSIIKGLFREKMINVINDYYEMSLTVDVPHLPNVDLFNYDAMKNFILEKLDQFPAAPFTVQRICELLTAPRKEYNRIDKYMRALEKNMLVVSTIEPGSTRNRNTNLNNTENGDGISNGLLDSTDNGLLQDGNSACNDINVDEEENDDLTTVAWPARIVQNESNAALDSQTDDTVTSPTTDNTTEQNPTTTTDTPALDETENNKTNTDATDDHTNAETNEKTNYFPFSMEEYRRDSSVDEEDVEENATALTQEETQDKVVVETEDEEVNRDVDENAVTITTPVPAGVQKRRTSVEPIVTTDEDETSADSSTSETNTENVSEEIKSNDDKIEDEIKPEPEEIRADDENAETAPIVADEEKPGEVEEETVPSAEIPETSTPIPEDIQEKIEDTPQMEVEQNEDTTDSVQV